MKDTHLFESLKQSSRDIRVLWALSFLRMGSYGLTNQVLTLYLESIGVSGGQIGIFMTLTMLGDIFISYLLTWYADKIGRRVVIVTGSLMMAVSGLVFAFNSNFVILLAAAVIGVISPSGEESGPFKSIEEASMAHITPPNHRPEIFAFYGLFGAAGAALGALICGALVDYLHDILQWDLQECYRFVFLVYTAIAVAKIGLTIFLSNSCEVTSLTDQSHDSETTTEETSLLNQSSVYEEASDQTNLKRGFLGLSATTSHYLARLLVIFMLDSFGYGIMPSAWTVYYFRKFFEITATGLGALFFVSNGFNSVSSIPSAYLAKWLGPVKAILFTQAPSAIFVGLISVVTRLELASFLLILYYATGSMDVVPRQVLLSSIVPAHELTKVMSIVNIGKTFARCIGPVFTGILEDYGILYLGFAFNGSCVLLADLILATSFLHLDAILLAEQNVPLPIS